MGARPGDGQAEAVPLPLDHADRALVEALRHGDEVAFRELVTRHHGAMVRVARHHVATQSAADEIAQEAWLAVIAGLNRFEGRSSLRTWIFSIVMNLARARGRRDQRVVPMSSVVEDEGGPTVDPERFVDASQRWAGHWASAPRHPDTIPESVVESAETLAELRAAIDGLPENQQRVLWLRDVVGMSADEVCAALDLTAANQRVLLHRARAKVRDAFERRIEREVPR